MHFRYYDYEIRIMCDSQCPEQHSIWSDVETPGVWALCRATAYQAAPPCPDPSLCMTARVLRESCTVRYPGH